MGADSSILGRSRRIGYQARRETPVPARMGGSTTSAADAVVVAHGQLRSALANLRSGPRSGGYYPRTPLLEPILEEFKVDGEQVLAVTRNRYGAEILNTDRLLIADVDLPELEGTTAGDTPESSRRSRSG